MYIQPDFMNNLSKPGLFTSQAYCRCEAQGMKLWSFTANALEQSRCCEIGSPVRENQPALNLNTKQKYKDKLCLLTR